MARAQAIFVVTSRGGVGGVLRPLRMFTVRHEAVHWFEAARRRCLARGRIPDLELYRCAHEGGHGESSEGAAWHRRQLIEILGRD
jgi:hypothetical protein